MASKLADYLLENPIYAVGQRASAQGSSTAPVQSPLEGLARALQGGIGGLTQGYGLAQAKQEQGADQTALAQAMQLYTTDPAAARKILASRPNLSDTAAAMLAQDVGFERQKGLIDYKSKKEEEDQARTMQAWGLTPPGATPAGGGNTQVAGGVPPAQAKAEAQKQIQYLVNVHNIPPELATTMVGNLYQESGFNPNAVHDGGTGYGMGGWRNERRSSLVNEAQARGEDPSNPTAQLDFYANEFKTRPEYQQALQAKTPEARQAAMMTYFRPAGYTPQNPQGGHGFNNRVQYAQQFSPQVAQGSADGQMQPPPQALNAPAPQANGETINYQGLQLPKAEVTAAMMIPDKVKRQEALLKIITDGGKQQRGPDAGTAAGDVHILTKGDPSSPEYHAAYNRIAEPKQAANGQLLQPDMRAYRRPEIVGAQTDGNVEPRVIDTPASRFQMSGKLADDFNQLKSVKDYREVVPIFQSMQEAATQNNRVADLNLVYGLAKLFDPTSVVREGEQIMVRNAQGLPDQIKGMIFAVNGGSQFPPEQRARIMEQAASRVNAYKAQYDGIADQFTQRAKRYGLDPQDVLTTPSQPQQPAQGAAGSVPVYDINGKRIK